MLKALYVVAPGGGAMVIYDAACAADVASSATPTSALAPNS